MIGKYLALLAIISVHVDCKVASLPLEASENILSLNALPNTDIIGAGQFNLENKDLTSASKSLSLEEDGGDEFNPESVVQVLEKLKRALDAAQIETVGEEEITSNNRRATKSSKNSSNTKNNNSQSKSSSSASKNQSTKSSNSGKDQSKSSKSGKDQNKSTNSSNSARDQKQSTKSSNSGKDQNQSKKSSNSGKDQNQSTKSSDSKNDKKQSSKSGNTSDNKKQSTKSSDTGGGADKNKSTKSSNSTNENNNSTKSSNKNQSTKSSDSGKNKKQSKEPTHKSSSNDRDSNSANKGSGKSNNKSSSSKNNNSKSSSKGGKKDKSPSSKGKDKGNTKDNHSDKPSNKSNALDLLNNKGFIKDLVNYTMKVMADRDFDLLVNTDIFLTIFKEDYEALAEVAEDNDNWERYVKSAVENFYLEFNKIYFNLVHVQSSDGSEMELYNKAYDLAMFLFATRRNFNAVKMAAPVRRIADVIKGIIGGPIEMVQTSCKKDMPIWQCNVAYLSKLIAAADSCPNIWYHSLILETMLEYNRVQTLSIVDPITKALGHLKSKSGKGPAKDSSQAHEVFDSILKILLSTKDSSKDSLQLRAKLYQFIIDLQNNGSLDCTNIGTPLYVI